jgi:hypothetical protein
MDILEVPVRIFKTGERIRCINNSTYADALTVGKVYVVKSFSDRTTRIVDDTGHEYGFYHHRFKSANKELF